MSTDVSQLYWSLIRARLKDHACRVCGASLERATVTSAGDGTALDDYGLSETSAVRLLAATEVLTVECLRCQAVAEIGTPPPPAPVRAAPSVDDLTPWSARALDVYRSILRARLAGRSCRHCGNSLETATVERANEGATLPELDLNDEAAAALIGWTQRVEVRCPQCGGMVVI